MTTTPARQKYEITAMAGSQPVAYNIYLEVRQLAWSSMTSPLTVPAGDSLSMGPTLTGAIGKATYSISPEASELPHGVTFNDKTGAIAGTPKIASAAKTFTVTATDSANPPQTASYSVEIPVNPSAKRRSCGSQAVPAQSLKEPPQRLRFMHPMRRRRANR